MLKKILKRFFLLCVFLIVVFIGIWFYEGYHELDAYETLVGTNSDSNVMEYSVPDRGSHIAYLETFSYQGYDIRYLDRGNRNGKVIVLLHGTPTNSWLYRKIIPGLLTAGYRVIVPDMLGFGTSSMPTHAADLSSQRQSEILMALLNELSVSTFSIAGHDQGSLWVWETITSYPARINSLIVFNSIADRAGFHPPAGFGEKNIQTLFTAWAMGSKPLGRIFAYGAMLNGVKRKSVATSKMINGYLFPLFHGMDTTYKAFITDFATIESELDRYQQKMRTLTIPTLVLRGSHDKILVGAEQVPVLKEYLRIDHNDIHFLDAGHFVQEEVPDEIVNKIIEFIG